MTTAQTIRAQGYQYFLQEAPELLQVLEQGLLTLQEDSSINKVNTLMRATHTIKGAAASLELDTIAKVAHSLEDVFRALCRPDVFVDAEVDALLFEGFECLRSAVRAELTETAVNEDEILNRTAAIFARLQDYLGDCFDQDTPLPTSMELGFDVTQSIFEVGVTQRLEQLAAVLETEQPGDITTALQTQSEVFLGLGESLNLPGFGAIAQAVIAALDQHPEQAIAIGQLALQDFQVGQAAVLAGDRRQGGQPSETLQALAQTPASDPIAVDIILNPVTVEEAILPTWEDDSVTADFLMETAPLIEASTDPEANQAAAHGAESVATEAFDLPTSTAAATDSGVDTDTVISPEAKTDAAATPGINIEETEAETETGTQTETDTDALTETGSVGAKVAIGELAVPSIQRLFQWVRKSVQLSSGQTEGTPATTATDPSPSATNSELELDQRPSDGADDQGMTLDSLFADDPNFSPVDIVSVSSSENITEVVPEGDAQSLAAVDSDDVDPDDVDPDEGDEHEVLFSSQSYDDDADALLENIWGGITTAQGTAGDAQTKSSTSASLSLASAAVTPKFPSQPDADPEVLKLKDVPNPHRPQTSVQQPTPLPQKGVMPAVPTVRIQIEHLDQLNYAVGELLTNHNQQSLQAEQIQAAMRRLYTRLRQHQNLLNQLQDWIDSPLQLNQAQNGNGSRQGSSVPASPAIASLFQQAASPTSDPAIDSLDSLSIGFDTLELEQYSQPQLVIQALLDDTVQLTEAVDAVELYTRQSRQTQEKQGRLLLKTRDALIEGRMFPLGQLFDRFPRVLQQLETLHHKPVELTLQGTDVLVDKAIGERLYDPILHLVRNAFDHGIESVAVRQALDKPEAGQLVIAAHHQGKHLVIEVRDDGQGLDFERIRQRSIDRASAGGP
ncbi:MAG: Hpt domain-containing protein [Leptolyngbyaceae cyanobacterium]